MGNQFAVSIQSPPFRPSDWKYLPQQQLREDYGYYRVLENLSTGQKIDEYEFIWPNQEELNYYLKSYNWRYKQPNVVATKFIDIHKQHQFCSRTFTASVYIQHVKLRLSDISDIPFPDNLYVIMEALEGYSKIYEHSKFFYIEENQICVDDEGNIKIWVNGDLSINYPNVQGHREDGEEEMVDNLVDIIADNTDIQTEPNPNFRQYFDQKRGPFGKKFEEARVLVMSYARINNVQIPTRFEAILNMDIPQQSVTQKSSVFSSKSVRKHQWRPSEQQNSQVREVQATSQPHPQFYTPYYNNYNPVRLNQNLSFGRNSKPLGTVFQPTAAPLRPVNYIISNMPSTASINPSPPGQPIQYVRPISNLQQYPIMHERVVPNAHWAESVPFRVIPEAIPNPARETALPVMTQLPNQNATVAAVSKPETKVKSSNPSEQPKRYEEESRVANFNFASDYEEDRDKVFVDDADFSPKAEEKHTKISKTQLELFAYESDERAHIAMSLPISPHLQKQPNKQLSKIVQQQKAVQSHIDPNQVQVRKLGIGLNELGNNSKKRLDSGRKSKDEKMSLKYYSSLYNELQIDPEIAADLAKYVGR